MDCQAGSESTSQTLPSHLSLYRVDVLVDTDRLPSGFTIIAETVKLAYNLALVALRRVKSNLSVDDLEITRQPYNLAVEQFTE